MLKKKVLFINIDEINNYLIKLRKHYDPGAKVTWGIIPAAGKGIRFGEKTPKQYLELCNEIILKKSISSLAKMPSDSNLVCIIVMLSKDDNFFETLNLEKAINKDLSQKVNVIACKEGKSSRKESVFSGLQILGNVANSDDWVVVHDAARPGLTEHSLTRLWKMVYNYNDGGILAVPISDTIKKSKQLNENEYSFLVDKTIPRDGCWLAQTPQIFPMRKLFLALKASSNTTDEASAMEQSGYSPLLVKGELQNLKITQKEDLKYLEFLMTYKKNENLQKNFFVGQGFDVHTLKKNRKLVLGGVTIPHPTGLMGHSDADVLIHAIIDAILGAACLGDIGKLFPDNDPEFENINSRSLIKRVIKKLSGKNLLVNQIDSTIIAEKPKLTDYIDQMKKNLQADTKCQFVNVKATTTEKLGYAGREEGIAAQAIVTLVYK